MSVADRMLRLVGPDHERMRREILLALEDGKWRNVLEVSRAVRHNSRGHVRGGPGTMFRTLGKLEDEGLVEITEENIGLTDYESRKLARLTEYGKDEMEQMGAANV